MVMIATPSWYSVETGFVSFASLCVIAYSGGACAKAIVVTTIGSRPVAACILGTRLPHAPVGTKDVCAPRSTADFVGSHHHISPPDTQ